MIFLQLTHDETRTFTYLLADPETRLALLVDPVLEDVARYISLLERLDLRLRYTLETHVHADHVSAGGALREALSSQTVMPALGGASCADRLLEDGDRLHVGAIEVEVRHTPGHTRGCTSYVVGDRVFTGDALLIEKCGRTDFQEGDAGQLYDSVHTQLFSLPDATLVFPGHDYRGHVASSIGWEKTHNERLGGGRSRADFVALMDGLGLSPPKHIHRAVPANLRCGLPPAEPTPPGGELGPVQAHARLPQAIFLDVREAIEREGPLGCIPGSIHIPMPEVADASADWARDRELVLVCRSGVRSHRAMESLKELGFSRVFNLTGGLQAWTAAQLPVVFGSQGV